MIQVVNERHQAGLLLRDGIRQHRQIPMGLGSGRSSLEHKVKCLCRKMFSESQSVDALRSLLARVRSVCTDMGAEMGLLILQVQS